MVANKIDYKLWQLPVKRNYSRYAKTKKYSFSLPLEETITIGNREYQIKIKEDEKHGLYIFWKNRKYPVEILQSRQNKYEILFNDISYSFTIETPFSLKRKKGTEQRAGQI